MKDVIRFLLAGTLAFAFFQVGHCTASEKKMGNAEKAYEDSAEVSKITFANGKEAPCGELTESEKNAAEAMIKYLRAHGIKIKGIRFITDANRENHLKTYGTYGITEEFLKDSDRMAKVDRIVAKFPKTQKGRLKPSVTPANLHKEEGSPEFQNAIRKILGDDAEINEEQEHQKFQNAIRKILKDGAESSAVFWQLLHNFPLGMKIFSHDRNTFVQERSGKKHITFSFEDAGNFQYNTLFNSLNHSKDSFGQYGFSIKDTLSLSCQYIIFHELGHSFYKMIEFPDGKTQSIAYQLIDGANIRISPLLLELIDLLKECDNNFGTLKNSEDAGSFCVKLIGEKKELSFDKIVPHFSRELSLNSEKVNKNKLISFLFSTNEEIGQILGLHCLDGILYIRPYCDIAFLAERGLPIRTSHLSFNLDYLRKREIYHNLSLLLKGYLNLLKEVQNSLKKYRKSAPSFRDNDYYFYLNELDNFFNKTSEDSKIDKKEVEQLLEKNRLIVEKLKSAAIFDKTEEENEEEAELKEELLNLRKKGEVYSAKILDFFKSALNNTPKIFAEVSNVTINKEFLSLLFGLYGINNVDAYRLAMDMNMSKYRPLALTYDSPSAKDKKEETNHTHADEASM